MLPEGNVLFYRSKESLRHPDENHNTQQPSENQTCGPKFLRLSIGYAQAGSNIHRASSGCLVGMKQPTACVRPGTTGSFSPIWSRAPRKSWLVTLLRDLPNRS